MSLRETNSGSGHGPVRGTIHPACPECSRPMTVKRIMPVMFTTNVDDLVFGCDECGTEAKRTVKRR